MRAAPPPRFSPRRREERPIGELLEFVLARYGLSLNDESEKAPTRPVRRTSRRGNSPAPPVLPFAVVGGESLSAGVR